MLYCCRFFKLWFFCIRRWKLKLADKLRERFLTDYSYATAEEATASQDNIHIKKQVTVGGSDTNTATVESQNIDNNIPSVKQNQNTDIEELENEEETIHTSGGGKFPSSNTEEPEFEESTLLPQ
jgi:hypothetical protein